MKTVILFIVVSLCWCLSTLRAETFHVTFHDEALTWEYEDPPWILEEASERRAVFRWTDTSLAKISFVMTDKADRDTVDTLKKEFYFLHPDFEGVTARPVSWAGGNGWSWSTVRSDWQDFRIEHLWVLSGTLRLELKVIFPVDHWGRAESEFLHLLDGAYLGPLKEEISTTAQKILEQEKADRLTARLSFMLIVALIACGIYWRVRRGSFHPLWRTHVHKQQKRHFIFWLVAIMWVWGTLQAKVPQMGLVSVLLAYPGYVWFSRRSLVWSLCSVLVAYYGWYFTCRFLYSYDSWSFSFVFSVLLVALLYVVIGALVIWWTYGGVKQVRQSND